MIILKSQTSVQKPQGYIGLLLKALRIHPKFLSSLTFHQEVEHLRSALILIPPSVVLSWNALLAPPSVTSSQPSGSLPFQEDSNGRPLSQAPLVLALLIPALTLWCSLH